MSSAEIDVTAAGLTDAHLYGEDNLASQVIKYLHLQVFKS